MRRDCAVVVGVLAVVLLAGCCSHVDAYDWTDWTALDEYVQSDDGYFSWTELDEIRFDGVTVYVLNMTSQKWQDETFSNQSVWWHYMGIAVPDNVRHKHAGFLFIGGQDNTMEIYPDDGAVNKIIVGIANDTGTCGGYILNVPNQPVHFYNDVTLKSRREDQIIAWSWRTYIDAAEPDPTVILRMPMTKAAKRGLDTINELAKLKSPETNINSFLVTGASKRGWTSWSIACTDQRVIAMAPMVFSMINMPETVMSHYQNMDGAWSFAFEPYYNENLTAEFYNPKIEGIYDVEDMYRYRERLDGVPKLEILSSGDEFFLNDDSYQWWNDMPGPKWMLMLPNAEHTMAPYYLRLYESIVAFWQCVLEEIPLPQVSWIMEETELGGFIVIDTIPKPYNISAWAAVTLPTDTRRDFRLAALNETTGELGTHIVKWENDVVHVYDFGNGYQYGASAAKIDGEWVGFFIECIYEGPAPTYYQMYFTTQVNVLPYTRPHDRCTTNEECYSHLV